MSGRQRKLIWPTGLALVAWAAGAAWEVAVGAAPLAVVGLAGAAVAALGAVVGLAGAVPPPQAARSAPPPRSIRPTSVRRLTVEAMFILSFCLGSSVLRPGNIRHEASRDPSRGYISWAW